MNTKRNRIPFFLLLLCSIVVCQVYGQQGEDALKNNKDDMLREMRAMVGHWVATGTDEDFGDYQAEIVAEWIYEDKWLRQDYWFKIGGEVKARAYTVQGWDEGADKGVMDNYMNNGRVIRAERCEFKEDRGIYYFVVSGPNEKRFYEHFIHPDKDSLEVVIYHPAEDGSFEKRMTLHYKRKK